MIDRLTFIENKQHWGYKFRFGLFTIPQEDFELIKRAMAVANLGGRRGAQPS